MGDSEMNDPNEQELTTPTTQTSPHLMDEELFGAGQDTAPADEGEESGNINDTAQLPSSPIQYNTKMEEETISPQVDQLYKAALKGDWQTAKSIFNINPSAITMKINNLNETALHIASMAKQISFLENLVKLASDSELAAKNSEGVTALAIVAASGVLRIAKVMIDKNPSLPNIGDIQNKLPVLVALAHKRKDMASFLFSKTNFKALSTFQQFGLLVHAIHSDYYDIALDILKRKPELAKEKLDEESGGTILHVLARKPPSTIGSSNELSFWKRHINSVFKGIYNKALMQTLAHQLVESLIKYFLEEFSPSELLAMLETPSMILLDAAEVGNVEFLLIVFRQKPQLIWMSDKQRRTIFHVAVENRQERVFSLIYEISWLQVRVANYYNVDNNFNMLHLAGMLAAPCHLNRVSGAALQMQRELLWFKEVEQVIHSSLFEMRCKPLQEPFKVEIKSEPPGGLTPRELFSGQHKQLLKDGEEWLKNTANSCMLVATLIATVVFAAAFTVPGGNDDKDGTPIFQHNQAFTLFVISDVAALVLSSTSIITFLSILTSRYAEDDFLMSLPGKLLFGLLTLLVSIACMVVAFSATFFIAYHKTKTKLPLAIAAVSILPIGCFCVFHFKLVVDILRSSYWSHFSLEKRKKRLF